jgi:hypothetical protein
MPRAEGVSYHCFAHAQLKEAGTGGTDYFELFMGVMNVEIKKEEKKNTSFRTIIGGQALIEGILMRGPKSRQLS